MKIATQTIINELIQITNNCVNKVERMVEEPDQSLQKKKDKDSWSALECIEHLNRYGRFYLPEIESVLTENAHIASNNVFKSGWLGNYFANSMRLKPKLNKMKTFKSMNPLLCDLDKQEVLSTFLLQQKHMLNLLRKAQNSDLTVLRTKISISKVIKLKLGDTFRVVIYHNERHIVQAIRALKS